VSGLRLAQHVSGTIMPIIRSSRVLHKGLLPDVFCTWFSSCRDNKTAVLAIWYLSLVRYCRQLAFFPGHCTIFQYAGIRDYLRIARCYFIVKKCAFLVPKYSISFLKFLPSAPFLCQLSFAFHVEIKCQLDATDEFLFQILVLAQHVSGTIMPIIRSSRVLCKWLLPVVFGAWFSSCRYGVGLRVVCPVCRLLQQQPLV
jgi:hypothetical protein